ncbi:inactive tyrosine-protein kinase PEAK1 [Scophthalmus maximus]|uniref:inactive tyrosine-protein kinase PEAK1 n=1 Tax=Scophthalmus maximus TaxID=52904 RepID=UPI001FA8F390|nr:inactive tyrosine-protein kinase PEAK1 [Scophthalmus maximus]XP_035499350.2 inactive tyrosine-protein kinase PEAK1 [Scophthalmus maximus]XP_035499352.2 inactive tyrosine-protein kinase PEAK1 [Scophthalmus maximus]XP_035499353.2 inactive tyrosine-protein kinase PEAK1 [Scophthalmus maximus]
MSACSTFTEHVWKPGECKNCFKPKSMHCLVQSGGGKPPSEQRPSAIQQQNPLAAGARANPNLTNNSQRAGSGSARSGNFRPPVAKKPTIAVKPTMMLPCSSAGLDLDCNLQQPPNVAEQGKISAFTVWNRNGLNCKRPSGPSNNNEGEDGNEEIEGYGHFSLRTPSGNNNNSGLTDVLKEIAGLCPGPSPTPLSGSKDMFWGRICSSYQRSLERGLPASSCLAIGSSSGGGCCTAQKRVSLSDSTEIISTEGGRFCYPEFSSEDEEEETEGDDDDDDEHESWDESDEELLAMEIRMRGQPRFANFRAATLSPVPFAVGKKWNTVPLRNRSLQRICAVDYDDSYDEILNGYPSMDSSGCLLPYGSHNMQGSGFLSNSESTTSPESSSSLPEDSRTTSSSGSSAPCALRNGLHSPTSTKAPVPSTSPPKKEPLHRALSPLKVTETHKAVLAIRLEDQDGRVGMPMPQALPGQPVTISFSPTEEQAKPYRVVNLEKSLICKPYTVVDVSASMANKDEQIPDSPQKNKNLSMPSSPASFCSTPLGQPLSPASPISPTSPVMPISPTSLALSGSSRKKSGSIRYQEVWTSSTSPRQKIPKVDLGVGPGPSIPKQHCSHKSAPTSPISGLSSSRTVPVKSPNLSEIKFNSFNNAGMPPFPIIIRDEPAYARSSKNAVKVPIVINPSAYDNLAVYKSFLGLSGELPQPKGVGNRVASHTYEEIGSSESVQSSSTEKTISGRGTSERASTKETKAQPEAALKATNLQPRTTTDSSTVTSTTMSSKVGATSPTASTNSPAILAITANLPKPIPTANAVTRTCKTIVDAACSKDDNTDLVLPSGALVIHREEASAVLSQIVASIQPPQSPPESPSAETKNISSEELYALPPDAMMETLTRPKSLFSATDGCLSKPKKETPSKVLSKSQSASAAVPLSSPRSEPSAPFPPPRSTSSPYHASNILQRHFGNWTKSSACSSPVRPSEGEASPGGDGRRISTESSKPKRWISFKSFFRRRKDEDEQREKAEKEKEKGKLVGLDGTVIHILPPPPIQHHHWFTEAKTEDPTQKPTIVFTYKPDSGSTPGDGEGELRVEECRETSQLTTDDTKEPRPLSPGQTSPSQNTGVDLISKGFSQAPVSASSARDRELLSATCPSARVNLGLVLGEGEESHASPAASPAPASEGSASLGEPEEDGNHSHHSHSPASSQCSATYSNLGQSRANMIPLKQPRNMKASNDTLASIDLDGDQPAPKATPPPLPKKTVPPRSSTDPSLGGKDSTQGVLRPRAEAKPGGTNLSVANPLYDLDSTWETASQSSSLSSEPHRAHNHECGDSLERPSAAAATNKGHPTNSASSLVPQPVPAAPSATTGRERRPYPSTESLAGRGRTTGRPSGAGGGGGGGSKPQRAALYRGLDSWDEVVGKIRGLHTDTLRKLSAKCEDRFMAGQKDHLRFGTDSWSHFRLTTGKPCCEAGDAVYYTASYAKDPLVNYAIKICRSKVKETQQQFFHSLAVRQSLAVHFNIQQDCGHFLADVPTRLLPWEEEEEEEEDQEEEGDEGEDDVKAPKEEEEEEKENKSESRMMDSKAPYGKLDETPAAGHMNTVGRLRSRVVVITREVPFQTVADFVREGVTRHTHHPELYERQVCLLLLQLCSGLEHMKPYHVTHCDLRLENLLLVNCQPGNTWNLDLLEPNNNSNSSSSSGAASGGAAAAAANATCPARLIISNFSQAKQKSALMAADPGALRDQSRLAPEIVTATQYRKCDEFQTGILIYEMLHQPNPFEETPELKEREYTWADLPPLPVRSLYSQGLQQLARLLLTVNPSERIRMSEARACLQCLLWGPREDLFQALGCSSTGPMSGATSSQREATLQNWLDLKRTLMMIKFAERSLDTACGVSLEDWLCCQYLAFASTDTLSRVVHILQQPQPHPPSQNQPAHAAHNQTPAQTHQAHTFHLTQSQPL